jgi:methylmalonyl-CoA mutase N-terminal domain/subunit
VVRRALAAVSAAAAPYGDPESSPQARPPLMPLIIDAVRARVSVGEISDALERQWGRYGDRS